MAKKYGITADRMPEGGWLIGYRSVRTVVGKENSAVISIFED
jgi:hypothetical protein